MVSITIRNLDERTKSRLRVRAAHRNRSMEDEARTILRAALAEEEATKENLAESIGRRFRGLDAAAVVIPARGTMRAPPPPPKRASR